MLIYMSKNNINTWSSDIDVILNNLRCNCMMFHEHHKKQYYDLKAYLKYFRIPTIILSGCNSVFSIGGSSYISQSYVSVITCLISLTCGIIVSIELYLSIQNSMENELDASKEFYLLSIDIYKMISLNVCNRNINGRQYLDEKYSIYCKLIENRNLVYKKIKDKLLHINIDENVSIQSISTNPSEEI